MRPAPVLLALAASGLALPATAGPPGHVSLAYDELALSVLDFKAGAGIADPSDPDNPCTLLLEDVRQPPPRLDYWKTDLRIATNLNGPGLAVGPLVPPLSPVGGWLAGSGGVPLGVPCPPALAPGYPGTLWLVWSGVNWRSAQEDLYAEMALCSQLPGFDCVPIPGTATLVAAACTDWSAAAFAHDYGDGKGKDTPLWDLLAMKNDALACPVRHAHDFSDSVSVFGVNLASQGPVGDEDRIKVESVVHAGSGTTYLAVCWQVSYRVFPGPLVAATARTHDWKLVVDLLDPLGPANVAAALASHLGPGPTDAGPGGPTALLRGLYSESPTAAGENGSGPCPLDTDPLLPGLQPPPPPEGKKPSPLA